MIRPPQQDNPDRKFSAQANLEIRPRAWGWGCGYDPAMYSVAWVEVEVGVEREAEVGARSSGRLHRATFPGQ